MTSPKLSHRPRAVRSRLAIGAAVCAFLLAIAGIALLLLVPTYTGVAETGAGREPAIDERLSRTLLEVNGNDVLPLVVLPMLIAGAALLAASSRSRRVFWAVAASVLWGYVVLGIFSIGLYFVPAAAALTLAAAVAQPGPRLRTLP